MQYLWTLILSMSLAIGCVQKYDLDDSEKDKSNIPDEVGDGIDQNGDGVDGVDFDGDGVASVDSGGEDCDDTNADAYPGSQDFIQGTCAKLSLSSPSSEIVDSEGDTGYYSSADISSDGTIYVAYKTNLADEDRTAIKMALLPPNSTDWQIYTVAKIEGNKKALRSKLEELNGKLHVIFQDKTDMRIAYATASVDSPGVWTESVVVDDALGTPGQHLDLSVDSAGIAHVVFNVDEPHDLYYASNATGDFEYELVAGKGLVDGEEEDIGEYCSMAVGQDGKIHIAARSVSHERLDHFTKSGDSWDRTPVDDRRVDIGWHTSTAIDSKGHVHIMYRDYLVQDLYHASNETGSWVSTRVDGVVTWVGAYTDIVIDDDDNLYVAYNQGDDDYLKYAVRQDSRWTYAVVKDDVDCGLQNALVLTQSGTAHIFTGHNNVGSLMHVTVDMRCEKYDPFKDTNCDGVDGVDDDGDGYASTQSGGLDCDDSSAEVQPAWVTTVVPDNEDNVGAFVSLAVDNHNVIHSAYQAGSESQLKYARRGPTGDWTIELVHEGPKVGDYASIAVTDIDKKNPEDQPVIHVAYYREQSRDLWHAWRDDTWHTEVVHETPLGSNDDVGKFTSLAVDKTGHVHITYSDVINGRTLYATNYSGNWVIVPLPDTVEFGDYSAIVLDDKVEDDGIHDGSVFIAYQNKNESDILLVEATLPVDSTDDFSVPTSVVTSNSEIGQGLTMAVDRLGKTHIAYRDSATRKPRYATNVTGQWTDRLVDSDADMGILIAIDTDYNKKAHIAYQDRGTHSLFYANNVLLQHNAWFIEPVGETAQGPCGGLTEHCGDYLSLQFDAIGRLHVIHYDTTHSRLLYSRKSCIGY